MAGKIPPEFIDRLLSRTDIVDVVDERVHLKKAGKDYQALCPFHSEKSPSFTVSADKQFYHCFGCGAHGSAIGFLMDYEHMSFPEAIEELANKAGLEIPRSGTPSQPSNNLNPLFDLMQQADNYYRQQLRNHPKSAIAVDYLKQRGLSGEIAAEFGIGFAPPGWDNLLKQLGSNSATRRHLTQVGMIIEQTDKQYDRFRDRIMFPIRDRRGRTIGFGGRVMGDDKPKYLNSPETPLFQKGKELYGLYEARKALRHIDRLLIVEGYMDVIALAQFGIRYAVATLGTATTADHLERLFRVADEIVFCFDGDQAGRDAAWKALNMALPVMRDGREIRFLFLPDGEDPDSLIRQIGADQFEQQVSNASHLSDYFFEHLSAEVDMNSLDGRARLAENGKPLIKQLPAGVFREMMTERMAKLIGLPKERIGIAMPVIAASAQPRTKAGHQRMTPVRWAIAILLQRPSLGAEAASIDGSWRSLRIPGIHLLEQLLELTGEQPNLTTAALIERWRDTDHFVHLNKLARYRLTTDEESALLELKGALHRLNQQAHEQETELLYSIKTRPSEMSDEEKARLKKLLKRPTNNTNPTEG